MTSANESITFLYDGDGHRVRKVLTPSGQPAVTTFFVYDALGRLAVEYSSEMSQTVGTSYITSDMLGSVRAIASAAGDINECYDYLPFGRMLSAADNQRNSPGCFQSDPDNLIDSSTPQKFTGKERDAETGLDFFEARYYSGAQGRFLSVDPGNVGAKQDDPQRK